MRKITTICFLIVSVCSISQNVGINTVTPRKTLEVAGDVLVSETVDFKKFRNLEDVDTNTFLKQESDGSIAGLNVSNPTGAALAYIQEFEITNMNGDWILDFDTRVDAGDYVVIPVSSYYNQSLSVDDFTIAPEHFSIQYSSTFILNGTWHLIADYPASDNLDPSVEGVWKITTLIFSRNFSKQFGISEFLMNGNTIGQATTPILD